MDELMITRLIPIRVEAQQRNPLWGESRNCLFNRPFDIPDELFGVACALEICLNLL